MNLTNQETKTILEKIAELTALDELENRYQATDAGARKIKVVYFDNINDSYTEPVWIKRSLLAKFYANNQVIGARNGITVVEI